MNKIALIDHKDSFTYNIVALIQQILGEKPRVIPIDELDINQLQYFDKIVLSPGPGMPSDYPLSYEVLKKYGKQIPILGICLGQQIIAEYFGGELENLPVVVHGQTKRIIQKNKSNLYKGIPSTFQVGLYHSWVVSKNNFPENLQITSLSEDNIIMSLQHRKYPIVSVQFHPESFLTEYGITIMKNFLLN